MGSIQFFGKNLNDGPCEILCYLGGHKDGYCDRKKSCHCVDRVVSDYNDY